MKHTRLLAALLAAIMTLSLTACGEKPAAAETTPAAPESVQTADGEADVQDAAYYDWEHGLVIRQWPEAFQPYEDGAYFFASVWDGDYVYAGLRWRMENEADPDGENVGWFAIVIGSSNPGATKEEVRKLIEQKGRSEDHPDDKLEEITTKSGQKIWVHRYCNDDGGAQILGEATPEQQKIYESMLEHLDELLVQIEFVKPIPRTAAGKVSFTTVDLDGNPVDSSVFANAEYTMINVWASFCSPCIGEMADLMKMDAEMENVQIITILGDATDVNDDTAEEAREIVETLNLTLPVYLTNEELKALLPCNATPTSFLVDSEGNPLGVACVGAVGTEEYADWISDCIGG